MYELYIEKSVSYNNTLKLKVDTEIKLTNNHVIKLVYFMLYIWHQYHNFKHISGSAKKSFLYSILAIGIYFAFPLISKMITITIRSW